MNPCNPVTERERVPKDGLGPRGVPEIYYTSRVNLASARYVKFVKKLRAIEEEDIRGYQNLQKEYKDKSSLDFFSRCERRGLVNKVANRVELCMAAYETDLNAKRQRLKNQLEAEEAAYIKKFIEDAQAGMELVWQEKLARLAYLLDKRRKENEEKYKNMNKDKCVHLHPCLIKIRAKEVQEGQLYQMREKQMRKMAEKEFDKMWYEVAMKESDALAARMEYDEIERKRRQINVDQYTAHQIETKRQQLIKEQEIQKQEALELKARIEEADRKELEENLERKAKAGLLDTAGMIVKQTREEILAERQKQDELAQEAWEALADQHVAGDKAKEEAIIKKQKDLNVCNAKMSEMKNRMAQVKGYGEDAILAEGQMLRDIVDLKRCQAKKLSERKAREISQYNHQAGIQKKEVDETSGIEEREYIAQLNKQIDELVKNKQLTDAQARKLHQNDLREQIKYNSLLKERAKQEELDQRKKYEIAKQEYQDEIEKMLKGNVFSDRQHPFMRAMASGLELKQKPACLCYKPTDYCAFATPSASK